MRRQLSLQPNSNLRFSLIGFLAFDIGGAQIKVADGLGYAAGEPFALWQSPELLAAKLQQMIAAAPVCDSLVVTMTGELADCFTTRSEECPIYFECGCFGCHRSSGAGLSDERKIRFDFGSERSPS